MKMIQYARAHAGQFMMYVLSGSAAAVADLGGYLVLLHFGMWYLLASVISSVMGFITAFLLHKFVVFQNSKNFMKHLTKYFVVDMTNTAISTLLLYVLVEYFYMDEGIAKFFALGCVVFWNFFVYKYVVYT